MEFHNRTRFPAMLFRGMIRGNRMYGSMTCKVTFDLVGNELWPAAEQPWKVSGEPWEGPQGPMAGDNLFYRGGVDLFVFGSAMAPQGKPVDRMEVKFTVGKTFRQSLVIFGDRVWEKKKNKYEIGPAKPFTRMPLTMAHAYGGQDEWDELPIPYAPNPQGKGHRMFEDFVPGTPLPNIEAPDRLIRDWRDAPEPAGCGLPPLNFPAKVARFVEFDTTNGQMKRMDPKFFNACFPDLIVTEFLEPGSTVRIDGVRANGPLEFALPKCPIHGNVWLDDHHQGQELWVDQIGVDVEASQVFVTYRFPFRYTIVPLEKRMAELLPMQPAFAAVG